MAIRKQNIPMRNSASEKSTNPLSSISTTNNGIIKESKGEIYMKASGVEKVSAVYVTVVTRDEYGNFVNLIKSSDLKDVASSSADIDLSDVSKIGTGEYINNQSIRSIPYIRNGYSDGAPTRSMTNERYER